MFGDYAFLCAMYGLSGASAVHPCLWCLCTEANLQLPPNLQGKTVENLNEHYNQFVSKGKRKQIANCLQRY